MVLFNKPIVLEFNSWCFSFRLAYGDEGSPEPTERTPAQGMGFHVREDEGDGD